MDVNIASYCSSHAWVLGANDPDMIGWLTVVAYLAVAAICYTMGRTIPRGTSCGWRSQRVFWFGLALALAALGFNKQLDLQTPFLGLSKHLALAQGWYRQRRVIQWMFDSGVAVVTVGALVWTCWKLRRGWRDFWLAYVGIIFLLVFIFLQASPVRHVNQLWPSVPAIPGKRHSIELAGIVCIGVAGLISLWRKHRKPAFKPL